MGAQYRAECSKQRVTGVAVLLLRHLGGPSSGAGCRLGEWVASLHDPRVGIEPTLMFPTAPLLRGALLRQAESAKARIR